MRLRWTIKTRRGKLDLIQMRSVWVRFRAYVQPHRWALVTSLLAAVGVIAAQVVAPWPIKIIFDYILSDSMGSSWIAHALGRVSSGPVSALGWVCAAVLVIAVADSLFAYVRDVLLAQTGQRVVGQLRQDLFAHLQTLGPMDLRRYHTGSLLVRLTSDIQMLRQMLVNAVITAGENGLLIVTLIVVMFWLNPTLALLGILTIPITLGASWRISGQIRKVTDKQRERESQIASVAHDVLGAMSIIQAFNRERIEEKRFARQNRRSIRAGVKATRLESKLYRVVSLASAAGVCAILYVGVRSVLAGSMTAGDLLVFVSYLRAVNRPMRKIAKLASQTAKATSCGRRIAEVFAVAPSVFDREGARVLTGKVKGRITFENITFSYNSGAPALSEVSLTIEPGERVAIVGHTGAGKSTLIKLLLRFYDPQEGCICLDDVDLRDVKLRSLRRHTGWVNQETVLFGMTVAENIALGRPHADAAVIRRVAQRVHADEFIDVLPDGYDTVLGQSGSTLSGGQRQRLALARALLRDPPVLLLDEPATGLDDLTCQIVEQAWMSPENTATTIVICHRLHDMNRFNRIVVLAHGRVCETGTHEQLLAAGNEYAALFRAGEDSVRRPPRGVDAASEGAA